MNTTDLLNSLTIMWQGMLGIFLVMITISLLVVGFRKLANTMENRKKKKQEDK